MSREADKYYREENRAREYRHKRRARKRVFDGLEMIMFGIMVTGFGGFMVYTSANSPLNPHVDTSWIAIAAAGLAIVLWGILRIKRRKENTE